MRTAPLNAIVGGLVMTGTQDRRAVVVALYAAGIAAAMRPRRASPPPGGERAWTTDALTLQPH